MGRQPLLPPLGLVCAVVVQDGMHGLVGGHTGRHVLQKVQKLLLPMPGAHLARHLARLHVQGCEQGGGAWRM